MAFFSLETIVKTFDFAAPNVIGISKLNTIPENSHGQKPHVNFIIKKS
jgi:hypothetical protein